MCVAAATHAMALMPSILQIHQFSILTLTSHQCNEYSVDDADGVHTVLIVIVIVMIIMIIIGIFIAIIIMP